MVDTVKVKDKWVVFRTCTLQTMAAKLLLAAEVKEAYPNITLITLALTMPVSTAGCERGFCKHNLIKNKSTTQDKESRYLNENVTMYRMWTHLTFPERLRSGVMRTIVTLILQAITLPDIIV